MGFTRVPHRQVHVLTCCVATCRALAAHRLAPRRSLGQWFQAEVVREWHQVTCDRRAQRQLYGGLRARVAQYLLGSAFFAWRSKARRPEGLEELALAFSAARSSNLARELMADWQLQARQQRQRRSRILALQKRSSHACSRAVVWEWHAYASCASARRRRIARFSRCAMV